MLQLHFPLPLFTAWTNLGRVMEGRDRVVTATILCPRGQHSPAAAPGPWALLHFLWVEKGRTKSKKTPLVSALTLGAPGYGDRQSRTLGCWALPRAEGSARSSAGKKRP